MNQSHIQLARILTICGTFPFFIALIAMFFELDAYFIRWFVLAYGAIIISFLSGMHWGLYLNHAHHAGINLLITSNVIALLAWTTLLIHQPFTQYWLQIVCFLLLLIIDRRLMLAGVIETWFYQLRNLVSIIVMVCLFLLTYLYH